MVELVDLDNVVQGDDECYSITVRDEETEESENITNWVVWFTIKESISDADADALIQKEITNHDDPSEGKTSFTITSSETEDLKGYKYYDIQIVDDTGYNSTPMLGSINFIEGVTESS